MIFIRRHPGKLFTPFFLKPDTDRYEVARDEDAKDEGKKGGEGQIVTRQSDENEKVIKRACHVNVSEDEDAWAVTMDVPGVKASDVEMEEKQQVLTVKAMRKAGDKVTAIYEQVFQLDEHQMKIEELSADLSDGVLTITIPKKPAPEPVSVQIFTTDAPDHHDDESKEFRYSLDLPGIKASDLKVEFHDDTLFLEAERKKGNFTSKVQRMFTVGPSVDKDNAKAYLMDGILTLVAPRKEVTKHESRKIALEVKRHIMAEEAEHEPKSE